MKQETAGIDFEKISYDELSRLASKLELEGGRIKKLRRRFIDEFWRRIPAATKKSQDLREGEMIGVKLDGKDILFAKVEGKIHAMDNRCPHKGFPLHKGKLEGTTIICSYHGGKFDLRSGVCLQHPYETYPCEAFSIKLRDNGTIDCEQLSSVPKKS